MKSFAIAALIISLAGAVLAAPVPTEQARDVIGGNGANGIFGRQGDNFASPIFDGAACIVRSIMGGRDPRCQGKGTAITRDGVRYTYAYKTNHDGTLNVTIYLERGGSCTYDLQADGKDVQAVIKDAAEKCVKEK